MVLCRQTLKGCQACFMRRDSFFYRQCHWMNHWIEYVRDVFSCQRAQTLIRAADQAADCGCAPSRRRGTALKDAQAIALDTASATIIESVGLPGASPTAAVHSAP